MIKPRSRRRFIDDAATVVCGIIALPSTMHAGLHSQPILDAHIHLFDPTRPGGVPWPTSADGVLFQTALPPRYQALVRNEGVLAAIAVECSPLASDNDWLLHIAATSDLIVGVIGDLDPTLPEFPSQLDRLATNPLFLGIRYGNLWNRNLGDHLDNPLFLANLRHLSRRSLVLESANPNPTLVADLLRVATTIPDLRIVIDHLPQAVPPEDPSERDHYLATLKQLSDRQNVFVKGSEILRRIDGQVPLALSTYKPWLDTLWNLFGENRLFFGSDWPNSDQFAPVVDVFTLAQNYLSTRSNTAARKFFWENAATIYDWKPRNVAQRSARLQTQKL